MPIYVYTYSCILKIIVLKEKRRGKHEDKTRKPMPCVKNFWISNYLPNIKVETNTSKKGKKKKERN